MGLEQYYLFIVILLFVLAASDLIVGVSNDAVNFLNSAIGSRVASRTAIMIVASLGIFIGSTFSSGMMEVARKGIFNPEEFYYYEIMTVFVAVMITDIILLDIFNTFSMPTSTTVSIVFELLGAAFVISLIKINANGESFLDLDKYINGSKAGVIILGIFLSIIFAFALGALLQYISRLLFTFHFEKKMRTIGGIWAGFAITAITYFLIIKGLKGASFVDKSMLTWVNTNTLTALAISFVFWSTVMTVFALKGFNILRSIVLLGTFSLAMAFAGNDLVNFIGVPIAAYQSYEAWSISGVAANEFSMGILATKVPTPTILLFISGMVMVVTLWFSKKARYVADTEINLARQDETKERFEPNMLSRLLVRFTVMASEYTATVVPNSIIKKIDNRFKKPVIALQKGKVHELPAFDMVRAAVNLMVAGILISIATSYKLPLSTTYVTFMVAMGTSLADRAWGSESAVYRVAGVLNVIGGWFLTAIIAFVAAGIILTIISFGKGAAIGILLFVAILLLARNYISYIPS